MPAGAVASGDAAMPAMAAAERRLAVMAETYRHRLRVEGVTLAAAGLAGSAALLAATPQARRRPESTIGQLAVLAAGLATLGPRTTTKALDGAGRVRFGRVGTGEPTPLWHVPVPMVVGAVALAKLAGPLGEKLGAPRRLTRMAGWDAGLRVTAGSALVGLYQAFFIERQVAGAERRGLRTYYRMPGSRLATGTQLGWTRRLGRRGRG
jgi:hypothetical protein